MLLPAKTIARVNAVQKTHGAAASQRVIVDTGNLTGKHIITDRSFFSRLTNNAHGIPIMVANDNVEYSRGEGACALNV